MADIFETIGDWLGLNKGNATEKAAEQNRGLIDKFAPVGRNIVSGIQGVTGDYLDTAKTGFDAYLDALGLNGAEGNAAARDRFTTGPGYDFALDQGEQAIMRHNSALGQLQSGDTNVDLMQYGVGKANEAWGDNLTRLGDFGNMYGAGVDKDVAGRGLGLDFESGLTSGYMGANNQLAAGKEAGQGAMLDALGSIAGIGGKLFGGYGGFGGGGNAFGGSVNPSTRMPATY